MSDTLDVESYPKFPEVEVQLTGEDGNAFSILGRTQRAMKEANIPSKEISAYMAEAMSGDYDHLLQTTMQYVTTY